MACPICYEDITDESKRLVTKCNHAFHEECLVKWIDTQEDCGSDCINCPMCRGEVKQFSLFPTVEKKGEYMVKKLMKWLDDLKRDCNTYEERCDAINQSFGRIPTIATALINRLERP
jgi:hypothetical protein